MAEDVERIAKRVDFFMMDGFPGNAIGVIDRCSFKLKMFYFNPYFSNKIL